MDKLIELAVAKDKHTTPVLRQRLAQSYIEVEIMRLLGMRTLTGFLGEAARPSKSMFKLYWSNIINE